jgi:hypothetical protein
MFDVNPVRVSVHVGPALLAMIEERQRELPDIPSRAEVIRRLREQTLATQPTSALSAVASHKVAPTASSSSPPMASPRLTPNVRRALMLLGYSPHGPNEDLLVHGPGFSRLLLAGLVRAGFAAAEREVMIVGAEAVKVVRTRLTAAGAEGDRGVIRLGLEVCADRRTGLRSAVGVGRSAGAVFL